MKIMEAIKRIWKILSEGDQRQIEAYKIYLFIMSILTVVLLIAPCAGHLKK